MNDQPVPSVRSTNVLAILSLVLGILGLLPVLPVIGSIAAIISGNMSLREIRANPDRYDGEGMARTGVSLGWVGIGLGVLLCILLVLGFLFFVPFSTRTIYQ